MGEGGTSRGNESGEAACLYDFTCLENDRERVLT